MAGEIAVTTETEKTRQTVEPAAEQAAVLPEEQQQLKGGLR